MGSSCATGFDRYWRSLGRHQLENLAMEALNIQASIAYLRPALAEPQPVPQQASQQPWSEPPSGKCRIRKWAPCSTSGSSDYRAKESNNLKGKVKVERQLVGLPWAADGCPWVGKLPPSGCGNLAGTWPAACTRRTKPSRTHGTRSGSTPAGRRREHIRLPRRCVALQTSSAAPPHPADTSCTVSDANNNW
jgi:hypothetical protein